MTINKALYSSASIEWHTPPAFFEQMRIKYRLYGTYNLDVAATKENTLCKFYYDAEQNSLKQGWDLSGVVAKSEPANGIVWCNPPYARGVINKFFAKAWDEINNNPLCDLITMLVPSRTDTKWFHKYVNPWIGSPGWNLESDNENVGDYCVDVMFVEGRLKFNDGKGCTAPAPFPSLAVTYYRSDLGYRKMLAKGIGKEVPEELIMKDVG